MGMPDSLVLKITQNGRPSLSWDKMGLLRRSILIPTKIELGEAQCSAVKYGQWDRAV